MTDFSKHLETYDRSNPLAIYQYSRHLIGESLHSLIGDSITEHYRKGKGSLGQMVEELFFRYDVNSNREADFAEAEVELKCTPLIESKTDHTYRIKERLVCTMIDYFEIVDTSFEDSHLLSKCRLMLLLFYLHIHGKTCYDYKFLYRILWSLPEKDLLVIKRDYDTIAEKVRRGEAHLLSEGDTLYLGACRKGSKGDSLRPQPNSDVGAPRRAFSLKPAYMRYVLQHAVDEEDGVYTNYLEDKGAEFELVSADELKTTAFEDIILQRFKPFIGKNYTEICAILGIEPYQAKSKYADVASLIASNLVSKRVRTAEEFIKSGITMKTIRLNPNGMPKESMSFKNLDYCELFDNSEWLDSEVYEEFTRRLMFVVFRPVAGASISFVNATNQKKVDEEAYILDSVFFWTMPAEDLATARQYCKATRRAVVDNNISPEAFWRLSDHRKFHVRPKARLKSDRAVNPHGGHCDKYSYWFNADYVKQIIENGRKSI